MTCALKRGVIHVGNYHYRALLTLSRDHYFRYMECTGGRRSLEAAFRRKPGYGFGYSFCLKCIKTLNFDICLVKSNLLTFELLYIVDVFYGINAEAQVAINLLTCGPCVVFVKHWDRL